MASKIKRTSSRDGLDTVWYIDDGIGKEIYSFPAPIENPRFYSYDDNEGQRWVDWFHGFMVHTEGRLAGLPIDPLLPWVEAFIRELFGWKVTKTGLRRYREFHAFVPGKNAKTQMGCGIAQGLTAIDDEQAAQVFWKASTKDQAKDTCYRMIKAMHTLNSDLQELFELRPSDLALFHARSLSLLQILSALPTGKHGYNTHAVIEDEPHETAALNGNEAGEILWQKSITRTQPLRGMISTAGNNKNHWYYQEVEKLQRIIKHEEVNDRFLGFYRAADPKADVSDPKVWAMANPGLGRSVSTEAIEELYKDALKDAAKMDLFKQCQLNIFVDKTSKGMNIDHWELCQREYTMKDLQGQFCIGGFDLSHTRDLTAFALCFPNWQYDESGDQDTAWRLPRFLVWYWCPEKAMESNAQYRKWSEFIETTPGDFIDKAHIKKRIKEIRELFKVPKAYFDPWHSMDIFSEMNEKDVFEVTALTQSFQMMGPAIQELQDLTFAGKLEQNGNPVLTWNVKNVQVRLNGDGFKLFVKPADDKKIDGWVACNIAYRGTMFEKAPPRESVYERRGMRKL